jgi:hypothetical protein
MPQIALVKNKADVVALILVVAYTIAVAAYWPIVLAHVTSKGASEFLFVERVLYIALPSMIGGALLYHHVTRRVQAEPRMWQWTAAAFGTALVIRVVCEVTWYAYKTSRNTLPALPDKPGPLFIIGILLECLYLVAYLFLLAVGCAMWAKRTFSRPTRGAS